MKKLLMSAIVFASVSSFAGILENRATGEFLDLDLDLSKNKLTVLSSASKVPSGEYNLLSLRGKKSSIDLFGANNDFAESIYDRGEDYASYKTDKVVGTFLIPIYNLPRLGATAYDIIMLPLKAPVKLFQNMKYNKDFNKLQKAINSSGTVTVSAKRFRRIEKIFINKVK